jgi:hypothetical protein
MDEELKGRVLGAIRELMTCPPRKRKGESALIAFIRGSLADPDVVDYIFWGRYATPEEVLAKALEFRPVCLPDLSAGAVYRDPPKKTRGRRVDRLS